MLNKCVYKVVFVESYDIVFEGLVNILSKGKNIYSFYKFDNINELFDYEFHEEINLIFINTVLIGNDDKLIRKLNLSFKNTYKIAVASNLFDPLVSKFFDDVIYITDRKDHILEKVENLIEKRCSSYNKFSLTKREEEVLLCLISGYSNKEISEKLNISVHTVVTHRKNISEKLGIKSTAGLVVYAVSNGLKPLDNKG